MFDEEKENIEIFPAKAEMNSAEDIQNSENVNKLKLTPPTDENYTAQLNSANNHLKQTKIDLENLSTATKEAAKETPKGKETKFKEGQIYTDAKGNRAMYNAGQWVPLK